MVLIRTGVRFGTVYSVRLQETEEELLADVYGSSFRVPIYMDRNVVSRLYVLICFSVWVFRCQMSDVHNSKRSYGNFREL